MCHSFFFKMRCSLSYPTTAPWRSILIIIFPHKNIEYISPYIFFSLRTPYNYHTPMAYFITILIETVQLMIVGVAFFCAHFIFFGICTFLIAFLCDLKHQYENLNEKFNIYTKPATFQEIVEFKRCFAEVIDFHCDIRQLSDKIK